MATSTIPALKAALFTRLTAALTGVEVTYGVPYKTPAREWVWLGDATESQITAAMGHRHREETWVQNLMVSCIAPVRESQQTLTERAFEILGDIEDSLRTWSAPPTFFDQVVRTALVVGVDLTEHISTEEREARISVRIACDNRI